jgi:myo-inositol-1(or 4)-monophosphatase
MTVDQLSAARKFAERLVMRSGERIRVSRNDATITRIGPSYDVTTDLDIDDEREMIREIKEAYPDHAVLGEESGGTVSGRPTWILDALDGTKYYVRNVPLYFSAAILQIGNDIAVSALYNSRTSELFSAALGCGASLNGVALHVPDISDLSQTMVTVTNPSVETMKCNPDQFKQFERLARAVYRVRDFGHQNYSICLVGSGGLDAHVNIHGLKKGWWDAAAGICVATEAGAQALTLKGEPMTIKHATEPFVVAGPKLVEQIVELFR